MFFTIGCVFYCVGDWDDLQIDLNVSLHDGFKIQFAGSIPVFLEFNGYHSVPVQTIFHTEAQLLCFRYKSDWLQDQGRCPAWTTRWQDGELVSVNNGKMSTTTIQCSVETNMI